MADPDADDDYFTKIGTGSLLSMKKLRKVQSIFERVTIVHQHHSKRQQKTAFLSADRLRYQLISTFFYLELLIVHVGLLNLFLLPYSNFCSILLHSLLFSIHTSSIERSYPDDEDSQDSSDEFYCHKCETVDEPIHVSYEPVQALSHDPEVSFVPLDNSRNSIDLHTLQALHHGCTAVHLDSDGRSAFVWVKLERSCGTITWSKPVWSSLRFSHAQPDFLLNVDPETIPVLPGLLMKYGGGPGSSTGGAGSIGPSGMGPDIATVGAEEGYIDLNGVKEVEVGNRDIDVSPSMKRLVRRIFLRNLLSLTHTYIQVYTLKYSHIRNATCLMLPLWPCSFGVEFWTIQDSCLSLVFGMSLSDNRYTTFVFPPRMASVWLNGTIYQFTLMICRSAHTRTGNKKGFNF